MGFKKSTSIKVMPGVRIRVSANGVSAYAGRTRIAGPSSSASRRPPARPAPSRAAAPRRTTPPAPSAPVVKPGLLAAKEEKALYAFMTGRATALDPAVMKHPVFGHAASAIIGIKALEAGNPEACVHALQGVIHGASPIDTNPFILKYLAGTDLELEIAGGVTAQLPLSTAALTLALAEALQSLQRHAEAIGYVEQLEPTYPALLSLTELYSDLDDWEEVLRLTNGLTVDSELTALLAILRSRAHLTLDQLVAARECIAPVVSVRSFPANIRFSALLLRANINFEENDFTNAAADLERILAENYDFPGAREALAMAREAKAHQDALKAAAVAARAAAAEALREQKAAEVIRLREEKAAEVIRVREAKAAEAARVRAEKAAETARLREEKATETARIRAEKQAEAARIREEKAAAKLALKNVPVLQTGIINLGDDPEPDLPASVAGIPQAGIVSAGIVSAGPQATEVAAAKEPGFYPDPEGVAPFRYWDGATWTSRIRMSQ